MSRSRAHYPRLDPPLGGSSRGASVGGLDRDVWLTRVCPSAHGWTLERTVGSHRQYVHPENPNVVTVPGAPGKQGGDRYPFIDTTRKRHQRAAMTEYLAIYERNKDGWWAYVPDLPGCTAAGDDRDEVERNAREAVVAHVDLLRATGRVVPEPTTCDVSRIAV